MDDKVITMPGVFRPEATPDTNAQACLRAAIDAGLDDVVIVGRDLKGDICLFGTANDADKSIGLLHRGIVYLADALQVELIEGDQAT